MGDRPEARAVASVTLGIAVVVPPLLFNGAFGWSVVATAALVLVALAAALVAGRGAQGSMLGIAIVAAFVLTVLQIVPLPLAWVRFLSRDAAEAGLRAAEVLGAEPPRFVPLSLDPGGTRERALAALAIAGAFLAGTMNAAFGRTNVLRLGALSVLIVVAVTLAHLFSGAERVYGVYESRFAARTLLSSLLNPNHLGGFCSFGAVLSLGLSTEAKNAVERAIWTALALAAAGLVFASLSRGAMASLAIGALSFAFVYARRTRGRRDRSAVARRLTAVASMLAMLATAAAVGLDVIAAELVSDDFEKLEIQRRALGLAVGSHPLLGVGRGAFDAVFAPGLNTDSRYVHPESFVVQWVSEWGVPFATFLLAAILVQLARLLRRARSARRIAGACALAALGLQNLVDFGLEMVGEAVVVAAVFGALVCERRRAREIDPQLRPGARRTEARALASFTLVSGLVCLSALGPSVARGNALELEERMKEAIASGDHATVRTLFAEATPLHPSNPSFPLLAGADAIVSRDPSAPRLLNRAMELAPLWPGPHEAAARLLASRGRLDQAAIELRAAEERAPGSAVRAACALLRDHPFARLADHATPRASADAIRFANALAGCLPLESEAASALDTMLLERAPELAAPAVRNARRAIRARDPQRALADLEPLADRHRNDAAFVLALSDALVRNGRGAEAIALLESARVEDDGQARVLEALVLAHARAGHAEAVGPVLERLAAREPGSPSGLARISLLEGRAEELLGRPHLAMRAYRRADGYDPNSGGLTRAARLAGRMGHHAQSYQLYSTLCLRNGAGSNACERRDRLRTQTGPERLP